jgi:hypothetical protein
MEKITQSVNWNHKLNVQNIEHSNLEMQWKGEGQGIASHSLPLPSRVPTPLMPPVPLIPPTPIKAPFSPVPFKPSIRPAPSISTKTIPPPK